MDTSEVASLKVTKGGRDRYEVLSPQLLRILRAYWRMARPAQWLFPGRDGEHPVHPAVLHAACRSACAAADLTKRVTVHTLRHSFVFIAGLPTHSRSSALKACVDVRTDA
jgi:integrase